MIYELIKKNKVTTVLISLYFAALFITSISLITTFSNIYKQQYILVHDNLKRLSLLNKLNTDMYFILIDMQNLVITSDTDPKAKLTKIRGNLKNYVEIWKSLEGEDASISRDKIKGYSNLAIPKINDFIDAIEKNNFTTAKQILVKYLYPLIHNWQTDIEKILSLENTNNQYAFENFRQQQDTGARICVIIAILVCPLLAITSVSFYFNRRREEKNKI